MIGNRCSPIIICACVIVSFSSAWASNQNEVRPPADWLQVDYKPLKSLDAIPAAILKALLLKMPYDPRLADRGERFNATDVIDAKLPRRRFMFGGTSSRFILVYYEHGGRALHYHLAVFDVGGKKPELVFAAQSPRVQTIGEVKNLVKKGKLNNKIEETHQEW